MILVDTESYQFATGKKPESYHLPVGRVQYFLFMILAVKQSKKIDTLKDMNINN